MKHIHIFLAVSVSFLVCASVFAAEIFFKTNNQTVGLGADFEVSVFLDTNGESINAIEGTVEFPADVAELEGIQDGGSIVSFWIRKPSERPAAGGRQTEIEFSGIVPGGYIGGNGHLFSTILRAKKTGDLRIVSTDEKLLLNDGLGSAAKVSRKSLDMRIAGSAPALEIARAPDTEPPESFTPTVARDPRLFDNRWFVVFATQDKGSGIDHYEIKESRYRLFSRFEKWRVAESPFALNNQELNDFIYVKAVDKSGNERVEMLAPLNPAPWYKDYLIWSIIVLVAASLAAGGKILWEKMLRR